MDNIQDKLIEGLKAGDKKVFDSIFNAYYAPLCRYCTRITYDAAVAEEIVQDMFCKLWFRREEIDIQLSLKAYLYKSVLNHAVNYLNFSKVEDKYRQYVGFRTNESLENPLGRLEVQDIKRMLAHALAQMPERRQAIFEMSRQQDLKYSEIAEKLNISVKTVEAQMSKALDQLRKVFFELMGIFLPLAIVSGSVGNELFMPFIHAVV